jgi:thiamine biosynthesis lipoprotein
VSGAATGFRALGTEVRLLATDDAALGAGDRILHDHLDRIDLACSRFRDESELAQVNAAGGAAVRVSELFLEAVATALRAARLTGGLVDPTVGTAMRFAGYDRDFADLRDASRAPVVLAARPVPGWRLVEVDSRASTVRVPRGVELDLGSTAKALAADKAARAAAQQTRAGILVSLGGDIAMSGRAPEGGWKVLVAEDSAVPPDGPGQTVALSGGGLATSSTTVRRWRQGDTDMHHLIDPTTGSPARSCWRTVTVAAACCVDANIAATAAIVMGEGSDRWLASAGLPARMVCADGGVRAVGGWPSTAASASRPA